MTMDSKTVDGRLVFTLSGRLDNGTVPELTEALKREMGDKDITIDLDELEYISDEGIRLLLALNKVCKRAGADLCLINSRGAVLDVLKMTGFAETLNVK